MSHDPIDRTLRDEPEITPAVDFPRRVMRAVRREAESKTALPFPWRSLAAGLAVAAGVTLVGVLLAEPLPAAAAPVPPLPLATGLAWATAALTASLGLAWWSVRFAGS